MISDSLLRGSLAVGIVLLIGILVSAGGTQQAAANGELLTASRQYLPLAFTDTCIPRPYIPQNDPNKDLALENIQTNSPRLPCASVMTLHSTMLEPILVPMGQPQAIAWMMPATIGKLVVR